MKQAIACVIDEDIIASVRQFEESSRRATYDISVVRALQRHGAQVRLVAAAEPLDHTLQELIRLRPCVVFNLAFSATPAEPAFSGALELLGMPFTGSGAFGIGLANDKVRSRHLLNAAGILVPDFILLPPHGLPADFDLSPPFIVKPVQLGNSVGIHAGSVVSTRGQAMTQAQRIWRQLHVPSMCDTFIVGREFQVGLIEKRGAFGVTAIVELHFTGAAPGRGFKSEAVRIKDERRRVYEVSVRLARLPNRVADEMAFIAQRAAEVLDLSGYAKVDLRMDQDGRIFVIEVNANPGLWSGSPTWRRGGFAKNLNHIMAAARRRAREYAYKF